MKHALIISLLITALFAQAPQARVIAPRITSEHNADLSDWNRFRNYHQWRDKRGNELALAVWQYLSNHETGAYHFFEILEPTDPFDEFATVRDPQKILNIYNMGYCGIFGPILDGVYQKIGFNKGRSFGVNLWNHSATEIWYENDWHYFDLDIRGTLLDDHGDVISLAEARNHRRYWVNPPQAVEPFFPNLEELGEVFEIYRDSRIDYNYRWFEGSHTMDYVLRPGESFTRWWQPQGGRWHHLPRYHETQWVRELIETEPRGVKPNHRHFTPWNHGNGLFEYQPNLTNESDDTDHAFLRQYNVQAGAHGLAFRQDGPAEWIVNVFTPYIIVAQINDLDDPSDDAEAALLSLNPAKPIDLFISVNNGLTWDRAAHVPAGATQTIDLTPWVKGTYGYQLKMQASGQAGETALRSLSLKTWVQVAPISLPRLKQGLNHLRYDAGDRYGQSTEPILVTPNVGDPGDLQHYLVSMPEQYEPERHTERIQGEAILHLRAPEGKTIDWLSVGASFRTHQGEAAQNTNNQIYYAMNQPKDFRKIYQARVPTWVNHWRYNWDTDIQLPYPAEDVFIKYVGDPALNTIRACLHVTPKAPITKQVTVTHGYAVDGQLHTHTVELNQPTDYTIFLAKQPENRFIKITAPSTTTERNNTQTVN